MSVLQNAVSLPDPITPGENIVAKKETVTEFPVDSLPEPLRGWAPPSAMALGMQIPVVAAVGMAVLSVANGPVAVGDSSGWSVPGAMWVLLDADESTAKRLFDELVKPAIAETSDRLKQVWKREHGRRKQAVFDLVKKVITTEGRMNRARNPSEKSQARAEFLAARERVVIARGLVDHSLVLAALDPPREKVYQVLHHQDRLLALYTDGDHLPVTLSGDAKSFIAPYGARSGSKVNDPFLATVVCASRSSGDALWSDSGSHLRNRCLPVHEQVSISAHGREGRMFRDADMHWQSTVSRAMFSTFSTFGSGMPRPSLLLDGDAEKALVRGDHSPEDRRLILQVASIQAMYRAVRAHEESRHSRLDQVVGGTVIGVMGNTPLDTSQPFPVTLEDVKAGVRIAEWARGQRGRASTDDSVCGDIADPMLMTKVIRFLSPRVEKGTDMFTPRDINRGVRGVSAVNLPAILKELERTHWVSLDTSTAQNEAGKWRVHPRRDIVDWLGRLPA